MGRCVVKTTAKIGARVDRDPSINPVIAGWTRCNRNDVVATPVAAAISFTSNRTTTSRALPAEAARGIQGSGRRPLSLSGPCASGSQVLQPGPDRGDGTAPGP